MCPSCQAVLTSLDLNHAYIKDGGAQMLARALVSNRTLVDLKLPHNRLTSIAAGGLAQTLRANCTLTRASLASNMLTDVGAVELAAALTENRVVTGLDLSRNNIGPAGGSALRQALQSNKAIVSLGELGSLPLGVGLRASLEWFLRENHAQLENAAATAHGQVTHRDAIVEMLPSAEREFRRTIFRLEDEAARSVAELEEQTTESRQVARLLEETIKRNAELVDNVAVLQRRLARGRSASAGGRSPQRRSSRAKLLSQPSARGSRSAASMLEEELLDAQSW